MHHLVGINTSQTITNKTISGSSNTFSNIPNSALTNRKITINTSGLLSGGGDVELGSSINLTTSSDLSLDGTANITGTLTVNGNSIFLGDVGIGTSSPSASLDINGNVLFGGSLTFKNKSSAVIGIEVSGAWDFGSSSYDYRRVMTVTNNDRAYTLPQYYEITVSITGDAAAQIYANTRADYNDFRLVHNSTELARNVTTYTSSNITFTFLTPTALTPLQSDSTYYLYYKNADLASPLAPTYGVKLQLDSMDNVSTWTSGDDAFALASEATTKQEGTGSVKFYSANGSINTPVTTGQGQLPAGVSTTSVLIPTGITAGTYLYVVGGQSGGVALDSVYSTTLDGSGNL
ncbi:hypothetical protein HY310_01855, partial [Candidatus Microgenomates bacterium]|nr:hypothetical protein [Candidatus Microgenomates bacterium]